MADSQFTTAIRLIPNPRLTTGVKSIDELLGGGLPMQGILEICGESGSGKTQLCLQLSLTAQLPVERGGLDGCVVYICTESNFPSSRLKQMIDEISLNLDVAIDFSDNIFVEHVSEFDVLKECLQKRLLLLKKTRNIQLLVIDSVAALFRASYTSKEGATRTKDLRCLGGILHELYTVHNIPILCVNQATENLNTGKTVAALGLAWSNMVTTRIQMFKSNGVRTLKVIFSPVLPNLAGHFLIDRSGLKDYE